MVVRSGETDVLLVGLAYPEGEGDRIGAAGVDVHLAHVGN